MSSWDEDIFTDEANVEFLDELSDLEDEEIVAAVDDACALAASGEDQTEEEQRNALAAATIAAIWAGAPFSAGEVVEDYPFIRDLAGSGSENLHEHALELLEGVEEDYDLEAFIEALS
ncbi:DUF4259 domain-containing protein [Corynebacterium minutissimum]|uniref:DUF4259 domain-containing protein n=1 Tax=Corynebacterium minutissimum TaxID=38301 RepID=A0A2X4UR34_9CORY|nr:DUF4259 domain-containing protein [Corynebacterium minutissimum]KHO30101.1 hypothetical protein NX84_04535 [Corynebacterium minutissimum]MCG7229987.1 DUF4259 domain-containing protein [Corynebacterium minutissimum]MCG7239634.1 DUF4259 domain-containing protein [Corynebacterium minutissimum]QPS60589.1 DUF4259 domain-containing protein [Corynebacterium minutissimum]QQA78623.1 DUF4259 domain-containing protein [Corynebacterium minutissimum]